MGKTVLSFVIPCYRSEQTIEKVYQEIVQTVAERKEYDYEIIAVNDCSPDNVINVLRKLALEDMQFKVVNLVRNVGKHAAVMAGYAYVKGDYIVNLDDDYQSPVYRLWDLIDPLERDECDIATARFTQKKEVVWKRIGSDFNCWVSSIMLDKPKGLRTENFVVVKRFVCDEVIKYRNPYPFLEGLFLRVTKRVLMVDMEERNRADEQKTGFTFWKSVSLFANGLTNFSVKPLRLAIISGFLFALIGFAYGLVIVIRKIATPSITIGWSSMMSVQLFSSGMIMLILGMIGEYVGRIFICINAAPQYIVRETINIDLEMTDEPA